jgi:hypothetical protein
MTEKSNGRAKMARQYKLLSADGHLEIPPERWTHRVPTKYRDRAPRTIHLPDGGDALLIEGQPLLEANFLDLRSGHAPGTWRPFGMQVDNIAGTGSPEQRVREQDQDGMDAEVLFAAMVAGPVFWRNIAHDVVYRAVIRGYNDWLAEEYCSVAPDRLVGMGVIPIANAEDAVAEMEHCKKLGFEGVLLGGLPNGKGYPTPEDDRFWAAALDLDMPVTAHVQLYRTGARANQATFRYPKEDAAIMARLRRPFLEWLTNLGLPPRRRHDATRAVRSLRAFPETTYSVRRNPTGLGAILARTHGSMVSAASQVGTGVSRLRTAEAATRRLRPAKYFVHPAIRTRRGGTSAPCRRRSHYVRHRFPTYRERMAELPANRRRDLRQRPGRRKSEDLGR